MNNASEHQKIAHAAEDGGRDKGSAARAERCGKFRTGRLLRRREGGITDAKLRSDSAKDRRSAILAHRGVFPLNATIMDRIYPHYTRFWRVHGH